MMDQEQISRIKSRISEFLTPEPVRTIMVLDVETNGLDPWLSILSCCAIKFAVDPGFSCITEVSRFYRFYYPREPYMPGAIAVNHLTEDAISGNRGECGYPTYFDEDCDFPAFCTDATHYIAHNADFERKFISLLRYKKAFCTMKSNVDVLRLACSKARSYYKLPNLRETAHHYEIPYEQSRFHDSLYDTEITVSIFKRMLSLANGN
jgi:DNA polymerase III epsilon subunit-like protein